MAIPYHILTQYKDYPKEFVEDLIFRYVPAVHKPEWNRHQLSALQAIAEEEWISIRSGRGKGKTTFAALIIPWYLTTRLHSRIIATAPKADQLSDALWAEIAKWLYHSPLKEIIEWGKEKIFVKDNGNIRPDWYAAARTAKTPENFSGFHEAYQMIIVDESSGVEDKILQTVEMTQLHNEHKKEIKTVLFSNPTKVTGYFYNTQNRRSKSHGGIWHAIHFKPTPEELLTDIGAKETAKSYGEDHDLYRVSVLGEFPSGNPRSVVSFEDASAARYREIDKPTGTIEIGLDVARFGDDNTVFAYRVGLKVFPLRVYKKEDTVITEGRLIELVRELRTTYGYEGLIRVKIDEGSMGGGVVDHLRRNTTDNIEIVPILFGGKGDDHYANQSSIMWANFSKLVKVLSIPDDDILFEEICGRNWEVSLDNHSRSKVESKADFKTRVNRSPDRADAVIMCCWSGNNEAKILPKLVNVRGEVFKEEPVRLDRFLDGKKIEIFGSVWHEKSLRDSVIVGAWDRGEGRLNVFWEGQSRLGVSELVVGLNNVVGMYGRTCGCTVHPRQFVWYGNKSMFGLSEGAMSFDNIKTGAFTTWRNCGIFLNMNTRFDLSGAIMDLNRLLNEGRIVIAPDLLQLKIQLETWVVENDKPDNDSHSLCLALANIASMLVQTKRTKVEPKKIIPYTGQQEAFYKKVHAAFADRHRLIK